MQPYHTNAFLESQYNTLLNESGCGSLACLRGLSQSELENATTATYSTAYSNGLYAYGDFYFGPSIDGTIIQDLPSVEFDKGHFSKVPLMINHDAFEGAPNFSVLSTFSNAAEGILFTNFSTTSLEELVQTLQRSWDSPTAQFWEGLAEVYPVSSFEESSYYEDPFFQSIAFLLLTIIGPLAIPGVDPPLWQAQQINGDANINCPTYYFAAAADRYNTPSYKSVFDAGVYVHAAADFPIFTPQIFTVDTSVATAIKDYLLSFIVDLDPNTFPSVSNQTRIDWPTYKQGNFTILTFQDTTIIPSKDPDASDRCDFLRSQSSIVRN